MRSGQGGERTRARKTVRGGPGKYEKARGPKWGARGRGARPAAPPEFLPEARSVWGVHPASGTKGGVSAGGEGPAGACLQLLAGSFPHVLKGLVWFGFLISPLCPGLPLAGVPRQK